MIKTLTKCTIMLTLLASATVFSRTCPALQNGPGTNLDIESFTRNITMNQVFPNATHDASGIAGSAKGKRCTYLVDVTSQDLADEENYAQQIEETIKQNMAQRLGPYRHIDRHAKTNAVCYKGSFTSKDKAYTYQCQIQFNMGRLR
jgi:hypothetical protein